MPSPDYSVETLWRLVCGRPRPEDVANVVLNLVGSQLSFGRKAQLALAAKGALVRGGNFGTTSMSQTWARPSGMELQLESARRIFPGVPALDMSVSVDEVGDVQAVEAYIERLNAALGKTVGAHGFKNDRLSHAERKEAGVELSRRAYNRGFRFVGYLEEKLEVLRLEARKAQFARVAKTRLLTLLPREDVVSDLHTACFLAYFGARCNLRSVFTNGPQTRAYDTVSESLFELCLQNPTTTNWWAIAHLYPDTRVLAYLSDEQRGELLGKYAAVLGDIAELLRQVWAKTEVNIETMIVRRGNDSTTWNNTAGAWNRARDGWFALVESLGMSALFEEFCPGKVPRLMAGDVVFWHRSTGGDIHPDTRVWASLPRPWEVFSGEAACGRALVVEACARQGVDAEKSGWVAARPRAQAVEFTPTPELVHGVAVGHPVLAKILRDMGAYSGKSLKNAPQNADLN